MGYLKGVFMKSGIILSLILLPAAVLCSCKTESGGPIDTSDPLSIAPDDPVAVDSALWFSGIYEKLSGDSSPTKTRQEVCAAINGKITSLTLSPPAGTSTDTADCAFLLSMIDKANRDTTNYGSSEYATDWPVRQNTLTAALNFIFSQKKFVVLSPSYGANGAASHDGESWVPVSTGRNGGWRGIAAGKKKYVALAASTGNRAIYSDDGITWKWIPSGMPFDASWQDLAFGGNPGTGSGESGRFVAVASYGNRAAYSDDGLTWTETEMPAGASWRTVAYGGGRFAAIATNNDRTAAWSNDGVTWTAAELPAASDWSALAYGNNTFVALALNSAQAAYSTDGATWQEATLPATQRWSALAYGNNTFVALALNSAQAAYSTDGVTWQEAALPATQRWSALSYGGTAGNERFAAIASGSNQAAWSADGITWTAAELPGKADWQGLTWGP
jgi:hypothetical protein